LSALYLASVFRKDFCNISKLDVSGNAFSSKAGEYIGQALGENPNYKIFKISFAETSLEEMGLVRIIEAVNQNKHIIKLNVGILTDHGLGLLASLLKDNTSLEEIAVEETKDHQKYWSDIGRQAFCSMLKSFTQIKKVKIVTARDYSNQEEKAKHDLFLQEIDFYNHIKSANLFKEKEKKKIIKGIHPDTIFENMLKYIDSKGENR
jgi:hypothetical protein